MQHSTLFKTFIKEWIIIYTMKGDINQRIISLKNSGYSEDNILTELIREGFDKKEVLNSLEKKSSFLKNLKISIFIFILISIIIVLVIFLIPNNTHKQLTTGNEKIKVGVMLDFSSSEAANGQSIKNAINIALDKIKISEDLGKKEIELIYGDSRCNKDIAYDVGNDLIIRNKVVAIIGGLCSSETLAVAKLAEANHVVVISPASTSPLVSGISSYVFRLVPSDINQAKEIVNYINYKDYKNIGIIYVNDVYGQGLFDEIKKQLSTPNIKVSYLNLGSKITTEEVKKYFGDTIYASSSFEVGKTEFKNLLNNFDYTKLDVIVVVAHPEEGAFVIRQLGKEGIKIPLIGSEALKNKVLFDIAREKDDTEGLVLFVPHIHDTTRYNSFKKEYKNTFNEEPPVHTPEGYDALMLIAKAITNGAQKGNEIKKYLIEMEIYRGISGEIKFDEKGDILWPKYDKYIIKNQKFVLDTE